MDDATDSLNTTLLYAMAAKLFSPQELCVIVDEWKRAYSIDDASMERARTTTNDVLALCFRMYKSTSHDAGLRKPLTPPPTPHPSQQA